MEPTLNSRNGMQKPWVYFWYILIVVILFFVAVTADKNLSHGRFSSSSVTSAAVILSFPMYLLFSVFPKLLNGLIVDFSGLSSFLLTKLNGVLFALYFVIGCPLACHHLPDVNEIWQLFVPFLLAAGLESLCLTMKGYAPIEVNRVFQEAPSIGEVWANACSSYYLEVFKDFRERLEKFEKEQRQIEETFIIRLKKMIVLIPLSCDVEGTLDKHPNLQYCGILDIHTDAQGGNVNRQYKNPVYKITPTDANHSHDTYVAIEQPNTLVALKKQKGSVPQEIWKFHRNEFISTLCYRLSDQTCCQTLIYDDLQEEGPVQPLSEFLIGEVNRLLIADKKK